MKTKVLTEAEKMRIRTTLIKSKLESSLKPQKQDLLYLEDLGTSSDVATLASSSSFQPVDQHPLLSI